MNDNNITIAFHGVDENHRIVPLELDEALRLKTPTHLNWQDRVLEIGKICADKHIPIAQKHNSDPAKKWIHILLIDTEHLQSSRFFDQIADDDHNLRPIEPPEIEGQTKAAEGKNRGRYDPIITISYHDFLDLNTKAMAEELADKRKRNIHNQNLDTRAKFLDSSIWHRYVSEAPANMLAESSSQPGDFKSFFEEVLEEVLGHWSEGLYYTVSAVTTLEFQLRMLRHSYIGHFGDGGHAGVVTPFKFHSERYLQIETQLNEYSFLIRKHNDKSLLDAIQWRMILVDDYANDALSSIGPDYECTVKKLELVRRPLDRLYQKHGIDTQKFKLVSPTGKQGIIDFCTEELSQRTFDVIFLDYLLGDRPQAATSPKNREYGHELLLRLIEDSRKPISQYHRDFFGRYWIFPVSSFPFALSDKLAQLGIGHLHSIWHLSSGGDPVTTPHLYRFYLFRFLKQKVSEYYLYPKALQRLLNEIPNFPNTRQGKRLWAKCLHAAISHYRSRLELVGQSANDGTQSPFLQTIEEFVIQQVKIKKLLDAILNVAEKVSEDYMQEEETIQIAAQMRSLANADFEDYYDYLEGFFKKIETFGSIEMDQALARIESAAQSRDISLDLSGLQIKRLPETLVTQLPNLKNLDLSNTGMAEVPQALSSLQRLASLNLSNNKIEQPVSLKCLIELNELSDLDLSSNPFLLPIDFPHRKNRQSIINLWEMLFGSK